MEYSAYRKKVTMGEITQLQARGRCASSPLPSAHTLAPENERF